MEWLNEKRKIFRIFKGGSLIYYVVSYIRLNGYYWLFIIGLAGYNINSFVSFCNRYVCCYILWRIENEKC